MFLQINDRMAIVMLTAETNPIELRAPDGSVLGQFVPVEPSKKMSPGKLGVTDQEFKDVSSDLMEKWYTPDDVMEKLRQLRKPN